MAKQLETCWVARDLLPAEAQACHSSTVTSRPALWSAPSFEACPSGKSETRPSFDDCGTERLSGPLQGWEKESFPVPFLYIGAVAAPRLSVCRDESQTPNVTELQMNYNPSSTSL